MPELRKDPVLGRWVIIAKERARRPKDFKHTAPDILEEECPFCKGKEHLTQPEIFSIKDNQGNWRVRVVGSKQPFLTMGADPWKKGMGPYDLMNAVGSHEVVVEGSDHVANMADLDESVIRDTLSAYCARFWDLEKDRRIKAVLAFKNYGWSAGGGPIKHSRSQLIATPVNLKRVKEELEGSKAYYSYRERCVYCDIIRQELAAGERVVMDAEHFVVASPFAPRFPFELWILPKRHSPDFYKISDAEKNNLAKVVKTTLLKLKILLNDPAYNFVIHTAPFRRPGIGYWSTIDEDYHWHIEITPRLTMVAGFEWGTGFYICPSIPEESAQFLRETAV